MKMFLLYVETLVYEQNVILLCKNHALRGNTPHPLCGNVHSCMNIEI